MTLMLDQLIREMQAHQRPGLEPARALERLRALYALPTTTPQDHLRRAAAALQLAALSQASRSPDAAPADGRVLQRLVDELSVWTVRPAELTPAADLAPQT